MNKCKECKHNNRVDDCYCNQCIHLDRIDNFEPKQWQPKYNINYEINTNVNYQDIAFYTKIAGRKPARDLAKRLKQLATLYVWASEHGYLKEWVYSENNYYIYFDYNNNKKWSYHYNHFIKCINTVYLTKEGAETTVEALNSGILVL